MAWEIRIEKKAQKELNKIPAEHQKRLIATLITITADPFVGKKMDGKFNGLYTYRVWPYRIIYKIYKEILLIVVIRVGHRQGVYN